MSKSFHCLLVLVALALTSKPATYAHKLSDSYIQAHFENGVLKGQWSIALRDLEAAIGLDSNNDRVLTWGEVKAQKDRIIQLAQENLKFAGPSPDLQFGNMLIDRLSDGAYAVLEFRTSGLSSENPTLFYSLLFDMDAQHRGIMKLSREGGAPEVMIFTPDRQQFALDSNLDPQHSFAILVHEGVWHIWKGFDHLLFLFALLLPAMFRYRKGEWEIAGRFVPVLVQVAKVVTAFTIAHSITLTLAALDVVSLPSALVESVIAASVVFAALNNVYPMVATQSWVIAFVFGLVHGFGFANVFADLGLSGGKILAPLFAFNVGVELGQLAVVLIFLPIAFIFRGSWMYRTAVVQYGSAAIALVAATWMVERIFALKVLPF